MPKTVIITGSSRGIGAATAEFFVKNGWNVVANYNSSQAGAEALASRLNDYSDSFLCVQADVSVFSDAQRLAGEACSRFGGIDVLINNAGVALQGLFTDVTQSEWQHIFDVNVGGVFNCCQAVIPHMLKKKYGKIINLSSIWGITGASCEVAYSTSKAAVIGLTKSLAKELGPSGIRVNCVAPGVIDTDMNSNLSSLDMEAIINDTPLGVTGRPQDVASLLYFLASEESDFITGQVISPNGGYVI